MSAIVVVPLYKNSLTIEEAISLQRTCKVLGSWDITIVAPAKLAQYVETEVFTAYGIGKAEYFDDRYFASIDGYNSLLASIAFYERFRNYTHMLVVQTDALVIADQLKQWCERDFSYVGAPWVSADTNGEDALRFVGVGNGGFSLRKIADFIRVLERWHYVPNTLEDVRARSLHSILKLLKHRVLFAWTKRPLVPKVNEDAFWGRLVPSRFEFFKVPPPPLAATFAFEVKPRQLFEMNERLLPFGCHAWERYDKEFWIEQFGTFDSELTDAA